jgi:hypothetical protein
MQLLQHISVQKYFHHIFLNNHNTYVIVVVFVLIFFFLGDLHGVSQAATSIIIAKVSRAIASKLPTFVKWPNQLQHIKEAFYNMAGFPGVVGCLDCTHVRIKNPHGDQPLIYCNRKGFYSLNVQVDVLNICEYT